MSKFKQRLSAKNAPVENTAIDPQPQASNLGIHKNLVEKIDVSKITLSPYQPRVITEEVLADITLLASNINEHGLMNPIVVRKDHGKFELIAGERRLRAVRDILQHKEILAYVKYDVTDLNAAILALIDNTARENLTEYELIKSIKSICTEFNIDLGNESYLLERFSLKRSEWSRLKSMLNLPEFILSDLNKNPRLMSANSSKLLCAVINKARNKFSLESIEKFLEIEWKKFIEHDYDPEVKHQNRPYIIALEKHFLINEVEDQISSVVNLSTLENGKTVIDLTESNNDDTLNHDLNDNDLEIEFYPEKHELIDSHGIKRGSIQFKKSTKGSNVVNLRLVVNSEDNEAILKKFQEFLETL